MKYLLEPRGDDNFGILNDDTDSYVGYVTLRGARYHVRNDKSEEIAVVKSLDEAIPALAAYYEANPPRWERESDRAMHYADMAPCLARYIKETQFDPLCVDKIKPGQWLAYRNGHALVIDSGQIAIFATCEEAQRVADAHLRDGYPNSEIITDGFSWRPDPDIEWWTNPYRVAARARLAVDACA